MKNGWLKALIALAILVNCTGMLFPSLSSTFTPYYASIAKHIVLSGNWTDLILSGHDWLDKPHLPFWLTAASFKIFGISSFGYIFPGFIFYLIGGFYTYLLTRLWYDEKTSLIATLFYFTSLHLMLSAIDVRAEAYLLGEIMPACYYWLFYDSQSKVKHLFLAAFFTGLAMMTKGIFILITIMSGLSALWIYQKRWHNFISRKWIFALLLSFVFVIPELVALYAQFDMHPEKVIFGHTHVSGIRWFFWDSQFGRFFNTGPIMSTNPPPLHWLFFVHTFLWAFLPWWPIFFVGVWMMVKTLFDRNGKNKEVFIYLLASFFITFILFSATTFQVDHYTNIIFPFASMICAIWLFEAQLNKISQTKLAVLYYIELFISLILLLAVTLLSSMVLFGFSRILSISLAVLGFAILLIFRKTSHIRKIYIYPSVAIMVVFIFAMLVNGVVYAKYDAGYQIARYLNTKSNSRVVGYNIDLLSLDLHLTPKDNYQLEDKISMLKPTGEPLYVVTTLDNELEVQNLFPGAIPVQEIAGGGIDVVLGNIIYPEQLKRKLTKYVVIYIPK